MTSTQGSYYGLEDQYGWRSRYPNLDIRSSTSTQGSYYGLEDQYGWRSRYPNLDIRSSYISPALSSSRPHEPIWNSNYPLKSSYADGAPGAVQAPQKSLDYSRPLALPEYSSSASASNSFPYNYPATVYGSSVYDFHILRKKIAHENANAKPKNLQTAKPVKGELSKISDVVADYDYINQQDLGLESRNEKTLSKISDVVADYDYINQQDLGLEPRNEKTLTKISDVVADYDYINQQDLGLEPSNEKFLGTFNTSENHEADTSSFSPRHFTIYRYNDNVGAYRVDIKFQRLSNPNPIGYGRGRRNTQEDHSHLQRPQGYGRGKQHSLEDGGPKDLWNDYSNRGRKRSVTNCYACDEDVQDFTCDYEIEYECSDDDDDGDVLNSYRNAKKQKTSRSSYDSSDYEV